MLSREECEKALEQMEEAYYNSDNCFSALKGFSRNVELFYRLIHEHFDNPPLKFEELKEGMWVWDNEEKKYNKILEIKGNKLELYYVISTPTRFSIIFKKGRFYRKQVEE